jgi:hypothetical protein
VIVFADVVAVVAVVAVVPDVSVAVALVSVVCVVCVVCVCAITGDATSTTSISAFRISSLLDRERSKVQAASGNSNGSPSHQQMQNQIFAVSVRRYP